MEENKMIYVIEQGYYSDKSVVGAYETEEEAKKAVDFFGKLNGDPDFTRYYSFEIGKPVIRKGSVYAIELDNHNNIKSVYKVDPENDDDVNAYEAREMENYTLGRIDDCNTYWWKDTFYVIAEDDGHALKIASDMLAEYKYRMEIGE